MQDLRANLAAFIAASIFVLVVSVVVIQAGIVGDDDESAVAGDSTITPAVLESSITPSPGATAAPTAAPSAAPTTTAAPGPPITQPLDVPILMYHQVLPELPADEFDARLTVRDADLEAQVRYLQCAGYTLFTMRDLFDSIAGSRALPPKPVVLTFDDGWADHYTDAFPILQRNGAVGSFAIVTGFVDAGGPYMTWAQIKEMASAGMEMMSHTVSHVDLNTSDDATDIDQVTTSKATLEQQLGAPVTFFVYPAGEPFRSGTAERQAQVVQMLIDAGYEGALLAGPNSTTQDPAAPFAFNRVRVSGGEDLYTFAASIYGPSPDEVACE